MYYELTKDLKTTKISKEREMELLIFLKEFQELNNEISNKKSLTEEELKKKKRCTQIKEIFLKEYIIMIKHYSKRYSHFMEYQDAIQEGIMFFFKAMEGYEIGSSNKFDTFFVNCIRNGFNKKEVQNNAINNFRSLLSKRIKEFEEKNGREPSYEERIDLIKIKRFTFISLYNNLNKIELDKPLTSSKFGCKDDTMASLIKDESLDLIGDAIQKEDKEFLGTALRESLKPHEYRRLLNRYFGRKKIIEIAKEEGVAHQAVSNSIKKAIKKLRKYCEKHNYENIIE